MKTRTQVVYELAARPAPPAYGAPVELSVPPTDAEGGPWSVLAYEAELKSYRLRDGSFAKVTAADIDAMVKNFAAYPKVPIVVEHADTRDGPTEWAQPRGWIVEVRRGSMTRTVGGFSKVVATLEGRLDVSPEVRLSIVGDEAAKVPPSWPFCSISTSLGVSDETGLSLGTVLHSVSLTSHPRLADLPRLAAAKGAAELGYWYGDVEDRGDVLAMLRSVLDLPVISTEADTLAALDKLESLAGQSEEASGVDTDDLVGQIRRALGLDALKSAAEVIAAVRTALTTLPGAAGVAVSMSHTPAPKEGKPMIKFLELAAALRCPAASEDAAQEAVVALARDGAAVRAALQLAADAPLAPKVAELVTAGAELPKVQAELSTLRTEAKARADAEAKAAAERAELELGRRVDETCLAKGWGDEVKPALLALGRTDRAAFDAAYPASSVQELAQRAQDTERTRTVAVATRASEQPKAAGQKADLAQQIAELQAVYREAAYELSVSEAVDHIQRGETPEAARKHLQLA